jgi:trk system potassium uptake protein TrkH
LVVAVFMLVGATSVVWHRMILQGRWEQVLGHRESYWVIAAALLIGIFYAFEFSLGDSPAAATSGLQALGHGLFAGISLVTTTGFEPMPAGLAALPIAVAGAVAIVGAATISTAGGIKFYRLGGMLMQCGYEMKRLVYPHSVRGAHFGSNPDDINVMKAIWASAIVALATVTLTSLLLALNHPAFHGAAIAAISAFSNIGPLYASGWEGGADWPAYADFDAFSQIVLAVTMTLGRLEVIALLTLVNFAHWRS